MKDPGQANADKSDLRNAAEAITLIGGLQHSQDHRLTVHEQTDLTDARGILKDLIARIKSGVVL